MLCILVHAGSGSLIADSAASDKDGSLKEFMLRALVPANTTFAAAGARRAPFDLVMHAMDSVELRDGCERHPLYVN